MRFSKLIVALFVILSAIGAKADSLIGLTIGQPDVPGFLFLNYDKTSHIFSGSFGMFDPEITLNADIGNDGAILHLGDDLLHVSDSSGTLFDSTDLVAFGTSSSSQSFEFAFRQQSGSAAPVGSLIAVHIFGASDVLDSDTFNPIVGGPDFTRNFQSGITSFDVGPVAPTPQVALGGILLLAGVVGGKVVNRRNVAV